METEKFGMPLFGVAWPPGEHIYVGGGGGKSGSGIENRVVVTKYNEEGLHEQVADHRCGEETVLKMAASPAGDVLLCAMPKGIKVISIDSSGDTPKLADAKPGKAVEGLAGIEVSCMAWDDEGKTLAVGGEGGELRVIDYEKQEVTYSKGLSTKVADIDVLDDKVLVTLDGGRVMVIDPSTETHSEVPAASATGTVRRARWARDGTPRIVLATIASGEGRAVLLQRAIDGVFSVQKQVTASKNPITGLDISREGDLIGVNDSEGNITVFTENLRLIKRWPNAHMVFGTALTFAGDGHALASVSADASTTVVPCDRPNETARMLRTLLMIMVMLAIAYLVASKVFADSFTSLGHGGEL